MRRLVLFVGLLLAVLALAQDIPVPCFPCEPEPQGCAPCHVGRAD